MHRLSDRFSVKTKGRQQYLTLIGRLAQCVGVSHSESDRSQFETN